MPTLKTKVCVVGAGVAGLEAAHTLLSAPNTPFQASDVVILEAQDRVGGRIKTDTTSSKIAATYDLGAAWFHDFLTNTVLHECMADETLKSSDGHFDDRSIGYYSSSLDGPLDVFGLQLSQVLEDLEKYIEIRYHELDVPDMSLEAVCREFVGKYRPFLTKQQQDYVPRMARYMELWYGILHQKISAKYSVMSHQGRNLYNKKGYSFLVDKLRGLVQCQVLLNTQVAEVHRQLRGTVVKTTGGLTVESEYLVVTVPHSVLALPSTHAYGITWTPPLPPAMQDSLNSVHFGALGKVILEFETQWWPDNDRFEVLANPSRDTQEDVLTPFSYPLHIVNYAAIFKDKPALVVLTQSPVTDHLEANPHQAWDYLKPMLQTLGPVQEPINTIVTDWTRNPYARGLYLALYVGDDPTDSLVHLCGEYDTCGLGAGSRVRFAGEHTISDGAGCVHGAYNSGRREAQWILQDSKGE